MATKVLVVDDSAFMRRIITDILDSDEDINVIGTGKNGKDALEKIEELKPDIITLDVEMPIMDGLKTLEEIMNKYRLPVVMLSSITVEGAEATLKALELGAIDFITKPTSIFDMDSSIKKLELINKIKAASTAKMSTRLTSQHLQQVNKATSTWTSLRKKNFRTTKMVKRNISNVIAIGTSTGGPKALQSIIPFFPQNINSSILVVQHMPPGFTKSLADRLNSLSQISVKEAEHGDKLINGCCYIAPGDSHMQIEAKGGDLYIRLTKDDPVSGHRPSVDVLMNSVASLNGVSTYGVILTGMGGDGAQGMKKIFENNGYTIAQDEDTCVIYGMPKVAVKLGAIKEVMPLDKIAQHLNEKVGV